MTTAISTSDLNTERTGNRHGCGIQPHCPTRRAFERTYPFMCVTTSLLKIRALTALLLRIAGLLNGGFVWFGRLVRRPSLTDRIVRLGLGRSPCGTRR